MKFFGKVAGNGDVLPAVRYNFGFWIAANDIHVDDIASVALEKTWHFQFSGVEDVTTSPSEV